MSGAPPADRLETEARRFLDWINGESGEPPLIKAHFWRRFAGVPMNERQVKLLERLLDGFEGKLATSRWAAFAKCSPDTALRDINELLARGVLRKSAAGGRSTCYELNEPPTA